MAKKNITIKDLTRNTMLVEIRDVEVRAFCSCYHCGIDIDPDVDQWTDIHTPRVVSEDYIFHLAHVACEDNGLEIKESEDEYYE